MTKVIVGSATETKGSRGSVHRSIGLEWTPLAGMAAVFALVSLFDIGLTFYPMNFGSAEWEFGTATAVLNNLPLAVVGIGLLAVAGLGRRTDSLVQVGMALAGILVVVLLVVAVMFARNIPEALRSVEDPVVKQGLDEAILRSGVQLAGYLAALIWTVFALRKTLRGDR